MSQEVIRFSNEKVRVAADLLAQLDNFGVATLNEWFANPAVQPTNDTTPIDDGSGDSGDGRPQCTGAKIHNIITRLADFKTTMDGPGVRDTVLQFAVNTQRPGS